MRKVGITIGIIVLILVLAVVMFAATFNVNRYRGTIQSQLEKRLNRTVALGDMHLGIFPPLLQVQNLAIADDPALIVPDQTLQKSHIVPPSTGLHGQGHVYIVP